jgi:hypothetical protein
MSHKARPPRLPRNVRRELEGLDWCWQHGTRHWQIRVSGRLVAIWPQSGIIDSVNRNTFGVIASIRQARRGQCRTRSGLPETGARSRSAR